MYQVFVTDTQKTVYRYRNILYKKRNFSNPVTEVAFVVIRSCLLILL